MRNYLLWLGLVFLISFNPGCKKKEETIVISGNLVDSNQGIDIEGVKVELWAQKLESGIYSAHYDNHGTEFTDQQGKFSFDLENNTYASVKLTFSKSDYYSWEYEIDGDVIKSNYFHNETYQMQPKAWLQISVKNENPVDLQDYFDFKILNGFTDCEFCCTGEIMIFRGMDVNEDVICQMVGHQDILIRWNSKKAGKQTGDTKSVFIPAFDTLKLELVY